MLATGGGAVLREENRHCLRNRGTVIYLHVLPEILFERTKYDKNRPLLQVADPLSKFRELYETRKRGAIGAPDLVAEIVSPGNTKKDLKYKFSLYEEAGVKEYWIIQPTNQTVSVFVLDNGKYRGLAPIVEGDILQSAIFPNLKIDTAEIFHNH